MPPKNQQKVTLSDMFSQVDGMIKSAATKEDVREIIDLFGKEFRGLVSLLKEKTAENKTEMSTATAKLGREVAEFEKRIHSLVDRLEEREQKNLQSVRTQLLEEIKTVENLIPELPPGFDSTELDTNVAYLLDMVAKMPKEFDATDIVAQVNKNTEDIEELKKRPRGTIGGGMTDMRIRQAMKNIVLTEAPVGDIDGVNLSYTVSQPIFAVLNFSLNGEFIAQIPNYTIAGRTITFSTALPANFAGKDWEITYFG